MVTQAVGEVVELEGKEGAKYVVLEEGGMACGWCNEIGKNGKPFQTDQAVKMHWRQWCEQNPNRLVADTNRLDAVRRNQKNKEGLNVRSRRGKRRLNLDRPPDPMDEVAERPGGARGGPAAYFIRPGATISEALIVSPNGAPMMRNGRDRANSALYQQRMKDKGFEYIGPSLTPKGVRRLAEVIAGERQDYILFLNEEMEATEQTVREADQPEVRAQGRTRLGQLERQKSFYAKPLDVDHMLSELDDILKAQKLAALSPAQREAMQVIMDEAISVRVAGLVDRMEHKKASTEDGFTATITNADSEDDF